MAEDRVTDDRATLIEVSAVERRAEIGHIAVPGLDPI
jgi:hypothetical protein